MNTLQNIQRGFKDMKRNFLRTMLSLFLAFITCMVILVDAKAAPSSYSEYDCSPEGASIYVSNSAIDEGGKINMYVMLKEELLGMQGGFSVPFHFEGTSYNDDGMFYMFEFNVAFQNQQLRLPCFA